MATPEFSETPLCPVCGARDSKFQVSINGHNWWHCETSDTEFVSPVPPLAADKIYDRVSWLPNTGDDKERAYEQWIEPLRQLFEEFAQEHEKTTMVEAPSLVEVACGYGSCLALAAKRGWKCFGVEGSEHARRVAQQKHGAIFLTDSVEHLLPHKFDLILLFDVLERLPDPYKLLYALFAKGAIGAESRVLVTTSNGGAEAPAEAKGAHYGSPPSHLIHYSAQSLRKLFEKLQFDSIEVRGIEPTSAPKALNEPQDLPTGSRSRHDLGGFSRLLCIASGSRFAEFMHERYVPGTWSKLAEYEHMPRYAFARELARGKRVLDFGCGTGYGAALLAEVADSVAGVDIDGAALAWARREHRNPRLSFQRRDDLGRGLPPGSFDVITCFEMIEHVDEPTQIELIRNFARLLTPGGQLIISTPNPVVTATYGENPYHLREMNESEFRGLLGSNFRQVAVLQQRLRPSVAFSDDSASSAAQVTVGEGGASHPVPPLAFVAVCSQQRLKDIPAFSYFDQGYDFGAAMLAADQALHQEQFARFQTQERLQSEQQHRAGLETVVQNQQQQIGQMNLSLAEFRTLTGRLEQELAALRASKIFRFREAVREPFSVHKILRVTYLLAGMATPLRLRLWARPRIARWKARLNPTSSIMPPAEPTGPPPRRIAPAEPVESLSVVIPTKNAGPEFRRLLQGLMAQEFRGTMEIIVVDSGSRDETVALAHQYGARVIAIDPASFNHGLTRNLGAQAAKGQVVIFLTQDALPGDQFLVANLVKPFTDLSVAGAYARQVPRDEADAVTKERLRSWLTGGTHSYLRSIEDWRQYSQLTPMQRYQFCNFDNVCSAIRRGVLMDLPFVAADFGEDIEWGKRALESGWKIAYEPSAWVMHSHRRSLRYEYSRNYSCHRALNRFFGLQTVPSLGALIKYSAPTMRREWQTLLTQNGKADWAMLAQAPLLSLAGLYGQYRGARASR
jgi:rhamnosyltransferase